MKRLTKLCLITLTLGLLLACTDSGYSEGEGNYSYLTADFALLSINNAKQAVAFTTDENITYTLTSAVDIPGATADSVYRALVYYNINTESYSTALRSLEKVYVMNPITLEEDVEMKTDPVTWNSTWVSSNGQWLNVSLTFKTGYDDEGVLDKQTLAIVNESEGTKPTCLKLYHDQNEVPEYYSVTTYISIPLADYSSGDTIQLTINTYDGETTKEISL